jgi:ABC-2 type transport system permease protein
MKDSFKLYLTAFNTSLQAKFEYRVDFFLGVLTSCMLQVSALFLLWIIFHQTPTINGWLPDQVILLFGMTAASLGLSELFFNHIWMLPTYIVMGDLDRLLTYPVNSLYFLLITRPELHSFGNLATGIVLTSYALTKLNAPWYAWALFPFLALAGCVIYTAALVIAASLSFKFVGPTSTNLFFANILLVATRYPISIYPQVMQLVLFVLVPYGAYHYMPACLMMGKDIDTWVLVVSPLAALLFLWVAGWFWRWGLNQYESTGS